MTEGPGEAPDPAPLTLDAGNGLTLAQATFTATRHACLTWHYAGAVPAGKLVRVGVWHHDRFLGVVIFSRGGSPPMYGALGLKQTEAVELTRVALRDHPGVHVSQILAAAMRFLHQTSPDLLLVISFADPGNGHHGGIYQAGNWIYTGTSSEKVDVRVRGTLVQWRTATMWLPNARRADPTDRTLDGVTHLDYIRRTRDSTAVLVHQPGKHRYVYPLSRSARRRLAARALPYPARAVEASGDDAPDLRSGGPGAVPGHRSPGAEARP